MLDFWLIAALGFFGSFGHCVGMCGPLAVAFSLSQSSASSSWRQQLCFHALLNLGRIFSYAAVGAGIGAVGSVLVAGGQLAGIDSGLRQGLTLLTGSLLVWMGLVAIAPGWLPRNPLLHPLTQTHLHQRLNQMMQHLSQRSRWWTPVLLGMLWGLIPCGFLYAAQVKAAETGSAWTGAATMLAFGLGTMPSMLALGVSSSRLSADRRSQLFRLGGWVTFAIGILTLLRSSEMVDYTGHAALFCLMLALIARPISRLWASPLRYRRFLGVSAFVLSVAHTLHMLSHTLDWQLAAIPFMLPTHQVAIWLGGSALLLLLPAALTSLDSMMQRLGRGWRSLHLLTVPALILTTLHALLIGPTYLGNLDWTSSGKVCSSLLGAAVLGVLGLRCRWLWAAFSLEKFYAAPMLPVPSPPRSTSNHQHPQRPRS